MIETFGVSLIPSKHMMGNTDMASFADIFLISLATIVLTFKVV
jgi:hypothetical protein